MEMGAIWTILGISSLIILPLPFLIIAKKSEPILAVCLAIYFVTLMISTLFGSFPVPLMGYGISPIIGYLIGMTWLIKTKREENSYPQAQS